MLKNNENNVFMYLSTVSKFKEIAQFKRLKFSWQLMKNQKVEEEGSLKFKAARLENESELIELQVGERRITSS